MKNTFNYYNAISQRKDDLAEAREVKDDALVEYFENDIKALCEMGDLVICNGANCNQIVDKCDSEEGSCNGCVAKAYALRQSDDAAYNEMRISNFR